MTKFYSIGLDNEFEEHDTLAEAERESQLVEELIKLRIFVGRIANHNGFGVAEKFALEAQDLLLELSK